MTKKSTRYLLLAIIIIAVFLLVLVLMKNRKQASTEVSSSQNTSPQTETVSPEQPTTKPSTERTVLKDYLPHSSSKKVIRRKHYALSYVEKHEQAEWVAYELTPSEVEGVEERTDDFREDPDITTGSASLNDYYRSGYDRGHLAPAGDMKFSEDAMSESFYMSNMSPQDPSFNRGIWRKLEEEVREQAVQNGRLFVVTGPVFGKRNKRIGDNRVSVPKAYYKVLLDYTEPEIKAIAFLLPNEGSQEDVYHFVVSIDSVEQVTNIDFFPALPDAEENMLESTIQPGLWIGDI